MRKKATIQEMSLEIANLRSENTRLKDEILLIKKTGENKSPSIDDMLGIVYRQVYLLNQNSYHTYGDNIRDNARAMAKLLKSAALLKPETSQNGIDQSCNGNSCRDTVSHDLLDISPS